MATEQQQADQRRLFSQQLMNQRNKIDVELTTLGFQSKEQFQKYGLVAKQNEQQQTELLIDQEIFEFNDFQIDPDAFNNLTVSQAKLLETSQTNQRGETRKQSKAQTAGTIHSCQISDNTSRQYMSALSQKERNNIYQRRDEIEKAYQELLKMREERNQRKKVLYQQYSDEIEQNLLEKMKQYKSVNQHQNEEIDKFNLKIKEKYAQYKLQQRQMELQMQQYKEVNLQKQIDERNHEIIEQMRQESIIRRKFTVNNEKVQIRRLEYQRDMIYKLIDEKQLDKEKATSRAQQLMINKDICQLYYDIEKINQKLSDIPHYRDTHQDLLSLKHSNLITEDNMRQICKGQINTARMMNIVNVVQGNANVSQEFPQTQQPKKPVQQLSEEEEKYMNIEVKDVHEIFSYSHALSGIIDTYNQLLANYAMQLNSLDNKQETKQQKEENTDLAINISETQNEPENSKINAYETIINTIKPVDAFSDQVTRLIPELESPKEKPNISKYQLISKSFGGGNIDIIKSVENMSMPLREKANQQSNSMPSAEQNDVQKQLEEKQNNEIEIQNEEQIASIVDKVIVDCEVMEENSNPPETQQQESEMPLSMSLNEQTNSLDTQGDITQPKESKCDKKSILNEVNDESANKNNRQNETNILNENNTSNNTMNPLNQSEKVNDEQNDINVSDQNILDHQQNEEKIMQQSDNQDNTETKEQENDQEEQFKELISKQEETTQNTIINAYNIISSQINSKNDAESKQIVADQQESVDAQKNEEKPDQISNQVVNPVQNEEHNDSQYEYQYEYEEEELSQPEQSKQSVIHNVQVPEQQLSNTDVSTLTVQQNEATEEPVIEQADKADSKAIDIQSIIDKSQQSINTVYNDLMNGYFAYITQNKD